MTVWKVLREQHRRLAARGEHGESVGRIVSSMATIVDAVNTLRNQASGAHPNSRLGEPEALLVINSVRTLFAFVEARLSSQPKGA